MTSSYAHVMDRPATHLDNLQAKKNFSVSHLLDLEDSREMVGAQGDEGAAETGRNMLESPGLTSGSDTAQQDSKMEAFVLLFCKSCSHFKLQKYIKYGISAIFLTGLNFSLFSQVWFQNRRAKFRRNERAMLTSKNASLLKSYSGDVTSVEQPIVPRPAPRPSDYLSWGGSAPYSAMASYSPSCANNNTAQGVNMANSIANLRLKAKEYSLNQVPTVN
uniref:Paired related homeobox 1a n=1 Tax=Astyanax mexicanus TaxID=7994 RepID=A0A8B9HCS0_ASTMX